MPMRLGPTELIIILIIVILLFGIGRIGKVAGELGTGIREFQKSLKGDGKKGETEKESESAEKEE
ncbi:MAG: twin-arginine translocase TatA/TatE family subunit [Anaerolineales bacterium]|nr:twin-arginine translocase TatA/TatE family subunit [Anaerolineales bacterium]